jgi:peptidyl-prolyl cis-trans isomerase A (cyclophilin A)
MPPHLLRSLKLLAKLTFAALLTLACSRSTAQDADTKPVAPAPTAPAHHPALLNPALATARAPDTFWVTFETTRGAFTVEVQRASSPQGADRLFNLVQIGYFEDVAFFRVISGFMAQFGIHGDPMIAERWSDANIQDDPVIQSNKRGMLTYAMSSQLNSRSTQFFVNYKDNLSLDGMGFAPVGEVVRGMEVVDALYSGYGEGAPSGIGPDQMQVQLQGNIYLKSQFPKLDYIKRAVLSDKP